VADRTRATGAHPAPPRERFLYDYGKGGQWRSMGLRVALGFPAPYAVGMANLAFQWIYHLMNRESGVRCDRFFLPGPGQIAPHTTTLETGRPLNEYDVVAFSLPFEPDYPNMVRLLRDGGVEPVAEKRHGAPLVIAGGVAVAANPEPVAAFLDAVAVGDAEPLMRELLEVLRGARGAESHAAKMELLAQCAAVPGMYVPALYQVTHDSAGLVVARTARAGAPRVVRAVHLDSLAEPAHSPIVSDGAAFKDMFLVELSRGCPYKCRFCLTRHTASGFRAAPGQALAALVSDGARIARRVGFVGTAFADAASMNATCKAAAHEQMRVSFSSIRLTDRVLALFREWGAVIDNETLAIAPEAATERMRRVLDKDLGAQLDKFLDSELPERTRSVKMYYLLGAPGERDEDVDAIAGEAQMAHRRLSARGVGLSLSVNPMVAKAHTPMQWAEMPARNTIRNRLGGLKKQLAARPRIPVQGLGARDAEIQTMLSLGDRRLAPVIAHAAHSGGARAAWFKGLSQNSLSLDFYVRRKRDTSEILPWDVIDHGMSRAKLYSQFQDIMSLAEI
jgi:radical SAM superfamily enzyme YgiQ (UPF0313 family)